MLSYLKMHLYQIYYEYLCRRTTHLLHKKHNCGIDETTRYNRLCKQYRRTLKKRLTIWKRLSNMEAVYEK